MLQKPSSPRTRVRRHPERGHYDRATAYAILDEALVSHLGFLHEEHPYVIPTLHGREGDMLYVHGSAASRAVRTLAGGVPVCVTATLVDGLVLARSIFNHSVNYRSVVVLGRARPVDDPDEKLLALQRFSERVLPGRWAEVRPPTAQELKATTILALSIDEFSAKQRTGPPTDKDEDYALGCWAGVLPLALLPLEPLPDVRLRQGIEQPACIAEFERVRATTVRDG